MKKCLSFLLLWFLYFGTVLAQQNDFRTQGIPRPDITVGQSKTRTQSPASTQSNAIVAQGVPRSESQMSNSKSSLLRSAEDFTFDDIRFWVGEGENKAALVIDWYYDGGNAMVWGYRWDGEANGLNMISEIAKEDENFLLLTQLTNLGNTICGIGYGYPRSTIGLKYDLDGASTDSRISFKFDSPNSNMGQTSCPTDPLTQINTALQEGLNSGVIDHPFNYTNYGYAAYDYDYWKPTATGSKWRSAWYEGYWSYLVKDDISDEFSYSGLGATLRVLSNGSWDAWGFQDGWDSWEGVNPREPMIAALPMILDNNTATMYVSDDLQLTPTIYQKSYQGQSITWTSSNEAIATVNANGKITAISTGSATITAKISDDCYTECNVVIDVKPFSFEDIVFWVGVGDKQAGVTIKWNDGKEKDALTWGYRWSGDKKVIDMLKDIAREDERFFILLNESNPVVIGGFGFDLNGINTTAVIYNDQTTYPQYPVEGLISAITTDYDKYAVRDQDDHWQSGVTTNGIWNYLIMEEDGNYFTPSSESILGKELTGGSWNAWNFDTNFGEVTLGTDFNPVSEYVWEVVDYTKGTFFVNEDWFGHTNGSVNFLKENGEWVYRAYTRENPKQGFGCTTQFGTIYGDNFYFVSKQEADGGDTQYTPGGRLVVADAKTLKKKAGFDILGAIGDGRSFLGVDEHTGYIGGSGGIALFNIDDLTIGNLIAETGGGSLYAGQIGTMLRVGDYVFACKQSKGILVIDAKTHTVKETIECKNIGSIVQSKDGSLWASAYKDGLWKINPYTFEIEKKINIPTAAQIPSTWGAWTSGVMAASEETNTIYWAKMNGSTMTFFGTKVFKYDIDNDDVEAADFLGTPFYELSGYDGKEAFYGSGLNVNPATDEVIITTTSTGYGANYQKNRVHIIDGQTAAVKNIYELNDYYWFPAMTVFPDVHAPVVSESLTDITIKGETKIALSDKVSDSDNRNAAIIKSIISVSDESLFTYIIINDTIVFTPITGQYGSADVEVKFNSNGQVTTKTFAVTIEDPSIYVTGVTLDETSKTLAIAETLQLNATVNPIDAYDKTVTWASDNTAIATVDANGLVTAISYGEATISVTTEDGGYTASCRITISDRSTSIENVANNGFSIYVEPVSETIIINTPVKGLAAIYDISGNIAIIYNVIEGENRIQTNSLRKGIYIVRFNNRSLKFINK